MQSPKHTRWITRTDAKQYEHGFAEQHTERVRTILHACPGMTRVGASIAEIGQIAALQFACVGITPFTFPGAI